MEFIHGIDTVDQVKTIRDNIMAQLEKLYIVTEKTIEGNSIKKTAIMDLEKLKSACDDFLLQESLGQGDTSVTQPYWIQ